ncbi:unnamed protein product [marine sediment metagenome]|uniref:Uncharacterized protein n=1 Tax=marine sediment metagenome TaxID=412755 RepID=X1I8L3_9ZZZZ
MGKKKEEKENTPDVLVKFLIETKKGKYAPMNKPFIVIDQIQEEIEFIEEINIPYYTNYA